MNEVPRHGRQSALRVLARLPQTGLILLIRGYRLLISPLIGPTCRFQPTCSAYALEALERHGLMRGSVLTLRRLMRCHPIKWLGSSQGFDPVPETHPPAHTRTSDV